MICTNCHTFIDTEFRNTKKNSVCVDKMFISASEKLMKVSLVRIYRREKMGTEKHLQIFLAPMREKYDVAHLPISLYLGFVLTSLSEKS